MQVAGKTLVLATFAIGFAMAGGAWWYNYQQTRLAAQFWGRDAAILIVGSTKVELWELDDDRSANPKAIRTFNLTNKRGLVHMRHALTYDANFQWDGQNEDFIPGEIHWAYALRFSDGASLLVVLFDRDFRLLAKVRGSQRVEDISQDRMMVDAVPCPRLGPTLLEYFAQIGVKLEEPLSAPAAAPR